MKTERPRHRITLVVHLTVQEDASDPPYAAYSLTEIKEALADQAVESLVGFAIETPGDCSFTIIATDTDLY